MGVASRRDAAAITATRHDVLSAIRSLAPVERSTILVAIDGRGGAGKSTLATWLAERLGATVVHTDDFASTQATGWGWQHVRDALLTPLRSNRPAVYTPLDWHTGLSLASRTVAPGGVVILEGVSASRRELGEPWDVTVWVDCPSDVRVARGLERDGADALDVWTRWEVEEEAYFVADRSWERTDYVVDGLEEY